MLRPPGRVTGGREAGQTLPLLLVALAMGIIMVAALLYAVDARLYTAKAQAAGAQQQYAAEAGMEYALKMLANGAVPCPYVGAATLVTMPVGINGLVPQMTVVCSAGPTGAGTWISQTFGTTDSLGGVFFVDANNGWVVGNGGYIYHTTNGGLTWTLQRSGGYDLNGIHCVSGSECWVVGDDETIIYSDNGGTTWVSQSAPHGFPTKKDLNSVTFRDASCGWGVGQGSNRSAIYTANGGDVWNLAEKSRTGNLDDVTFDGAGTAWAVGNSGEIWTVSCSGVTTERSWPAENDNLNGVDFVNSTTGWVVGDNRTILVTRNAGATWAQQTITVTKRLLDVFFLDANNGVLVGEDGTAFYTANGGSQWDWLATGVGTTADFNEVFFVDACHGWIVGKLDSGVALLLRITCAATAGTYDITSVISDTSITARASATGGQVTVISWQIQ